MRTNSESEWLHILWKGAKMGMISPKARLALGPSWVPPTCLICDGGEFCVDGLHMTFPVHVAFPMSTVLPFSPVVPTWVG